jgi:hypothetical protein
VQREHEAVTRRRRTLKVGRPGAGTLLGLKLGKKGKPVKLAGGTPTKRLGGSHYVLALNAQESADMACLQTPMIA